ncbi:MAG: bifunctional diaminohydroxyphosphoribosylaminopyrimidine deaminase/5-amino-6-(5-phosphoribosylamino)uracil reductase RibD [Alphaproteobacteria bacterium]|nr:bifunctional diaminohydroxyphosphoribosylaminopyrimidine deaminase/5-amino-6-(5-phosphoribosylamino)uracil reductase RibD [Alphaproteobacteria bacterium]
MAIGPYDPEADADSMRAALTLARRGQGVTGPNPSVGCIIVKDGRVVGRGSTAPGGRPHAEPTALAMAGAAARGATVYVTLEPCCHWGQTPPCTDALIAAGIGRIVIALRDPDERVNGEGIARLRQAGIVVEEGLLADDAKEAIAGFATRTRLGRPLVTLKLASTLDGRIATETGESQWITGEMARKAAHGLRGRHDAIMVGIGTVLSDDPDLTCRIPGFRPVPAARIVADSRLRTPLTSRLVVTAGQVPTWLLHREDADPERRRALADAGVRPLAVAGSEAGIDIAAGLAMLGEAGINRLMIEGGATLAASLFRADLVDRIAWFHAPSVIGGDGLPSTQGFGLAALAAMPRFTRVSAVPVGADLLTLLRRTD